MTSDRNVVQEQINAIIQFFEDKTDGQAVKKPWLPDHPLPRKYEGWKYTNILRDLIESDLSTARREARVEEVEQALSVTAGNSEQDAVLNRYLLERLQALAKEEHHEE